MKKIMCFTFVLVLLVSYVSAFAATETVTYEADFSSDKILKDPNINYQLTENIKFEDKKLTVDDTSWAAMGTRISLKAPYKAWAEISTNYSSKMGNGDALAIGIRVPSANELWIDKGIWLLCRSDKVSLCVNNMQGSMVTFNVPQDLSQDTKIFIDDSGKEILVYTLEHKDKKIILAKLVLGENEISVYDSNAQLAGAVKDCAFSSEGFFRLMSHYSISTISQFGYTYEKEKYVPMEKVNFRDTYNDTWVATDDLGRKTPTFDTVGAPRDDKYVGVFYFLWHNATSGQLYDHNKAYLEGGTKAVWDMIPQGPMGFAHYWAQPYFGYYRSDDEWVIRKHAEMLTDAGVDFIFFDNSNSVTYAKEHETLLKVYRQILEEGGNPPKVAFFLGDNPDYSKKVLDELWSTIYKDKRYEELYFMWEGKPLVLGNLANVDKEIADKFTARLSWAFNEWIGDGKNKWSWLTDFPQLPGRNSDGILEQMSVSVGRGAIDEEPVTRGRSYAKGVQPTSGVDFNFDLKESAYGLRAAEQWDRAITIDPSIVMVTGWNEWWAGRWEDGANGQTLAATYKVIAGDSVKKHYYVDAFNPEYSRDVEPMSGGFGDSYYYQLASYIRQFKGVRQIPLATGQKTIDLAAGFEQWSSVSPEYRDTIYDTTHRNHASFINLTTYVNTSGRNDISIAKVSRDKDFVSFYVETMDDITKAEGENWMNLFINTDCDYNNGWKGYDLIVNRQRDGQSVSIEKNVGGFKWEKIDSAQYVISKNKMMIKVPAKYISGADFEFKWADNSVKTDNVMEFLDQGDSAPDGRFNFKYLSNDSTNLSTYIGSGAVVMAINNPNALIGEEKVKIDENDTNIVPMIINSRTLIPLRFASQAFGANVEWDDKTQTITIINNSTKIRFVIGKATVEINGTISAIDVAPEIMFNRTFIPIRALSEALNKNILWDEASKTIIISNQKVEKSDKMLSIIKSKLN